DIPVNTVGYTRDPEKIIAYLIPLPPPSSKGQTLDVPQRYMIYTPPAPHLLKPTTTNTGTIKVKEGKRHKGKRLIQQEVRKAKTKHVTELVLIHPASVLADYTPREVHAEVGAQLARTQRRAARDSVISTLLFPPSLVIDTLAAVVWPFGGLAEIDGVWMYASISGYLTARSVTRRMEREPVGDEYGEGFQDLGQSRTLKVHMVPDDAMDTMASYFQEICHQRNPKAFGSPGIPPTKTDVLASIGWWPDRRGRAPGVEHPGDWEDENWQTRQVKEDMDKVLTKAAKSWDKWCKSYAKYPERAMKE
ncbi:hypothetical protein F5883DRAFT_357802, partial [Diaporthe sp. PMI_573]